MLIFWACTQDTGYSLRFVHKYLFKYIEFKNLRFPFFLRKPIESMRCDEKWSKRWRCRVIFILARKINRSMSPHQNTNIFPPSTLHLFPYLVLLLLLLFRFNLFHMCISFDHRKMQLLPFELLHARVSLLPILQIMNVVIEINFQLSETDWWHLFSNIIQF